MSAYWGNYTQTNTRKIFAGVDIEGNVFASGPGGILVISSKGELIGRINIDRPVSNLAFGADGRLYITATDIVVRFYIKTKAIRVLTKHK
jgi:gluconolactonase